MMARRRSINLSMVMSKQVNCQKWVGSKCHWRESTVIIMEQNQSTNIEARQDAKKCHKKNNCLVCVWQTRQLCWCSEWRVQQNCQTSHTGMQQSDPRWVTSACAPADAVATVRTTATITDAPYICTFNASFWKLGQPLTADQPKLFLHCCNQKCSL